MKAMLMTAVGGPEVLEPRELPRPGLRGPRDLLVRLRAAGVNPVDTKLRSRGTYYPDRLPAILGLDGAGVVEETGPEARLFRPGDAVAFCYGGLGDHPGTYAQYAVVDERWAAPKPEALDFAQAAALPLVSITAWESLHERAHVAAGQRVLVHGGAGGVGHVAVQLARLAGARVAATVSDADKAAFVEGLGAERAIRYREEDFVAAAQAWSDGRGVDLLLDTVGGPVFQRSQAAVRYGGDLVTLLQPAPDTDWKEARLRNLRVGLELMLTPQLQGLEAELERQAGIVRQALELAAAGKLRVEVSHRLPLEQAAEAHRLLEAGGMRGKVVLLID